MRFLIAVLALAAAGQTQFPVIAHHKGPTPQKLPAPSAEPSIAQGDPDEMYRDIVSGTLERRKAAYRAMGSFDWADEDPLEVRLLAVNLDEDPELERVLMAGITSFRLSRFSTSAIRIGCMSGVSCAVGPVPLQTAARLLS